MTGNATEAPPSEVAPATKLPNTIVMERAKRGYPGSVSPSVAVALRMEGGFALEGRTVNRCQACCCDM